MSKKVKQKKKHKILSHPILATILLIIWGLFFYSVGGEVIGYIAERCGFKYAKELTGFACAAFALLALWNHKSHFKPEYKGSFANIWFPAKDLKIAYLAYFAALAIVDMYGFIGNSVQVTANALALACMAGFGEEMAVRALPISVMMRDWMDEKHIPFAACFTAVLFGAVHFMNISAGAAVDVTIIQFIFATGIGIFFAAVYLRTGNLWLTIIMHTVHDFLGFIIVGATSESGVILEISTFDAVASIILGVVATVLGLYLVRKSVRGQIVEIWKERWSVEDVETAETSELEVTEA